MYLLVMLNMQINYTSSDPEKISIINLDGLLAFE